MKVVASLLTLLALACNSVYAQGEPGQIPAPVQAEVIDDIRPAEDLAPDSTPDVASNEPLDILFVSAPLEQDYASFEYNQDYGTEVVEEATPLMKCPKVSDCATLSERVASWLCDYTNYKIEAMTWKANFEEWWSSCDESDSTKSLWGSSFDCIDTSHVKCRNKDKLMCTDLGMDCPVCVCSDGMYKDPRAVYRLWKDEVTMFRERFETYRRRVESCTQSGTRPAGCATVTPTPEPTDEPGSGSGYSGDFSGSGSGSGEGDEWDDSVNVHL